MVNEIMNVKCLKNIGFLISVLAVATLPMQMQAQDQDWEDDGAIQDAEVVIEKDRQITLDKANRG